MTRHMRRLATELANTSYYQVLRARTRLGMQRLGATGVVKMHTAPNRFEIVVREMLILGVCLGAAATLVLAVELRDRGSDWAVLAFFAQCGLFVLAGYIGYAVDRRGPLPREIDFQRLRAGLDANRVRLVYDGTGHDPLAGVPMPTAVRGGIRWGQRRVIRKADEIEARCLLPCGCRLPWREDQRGRADLIDRSGCTEGHHAW